jgi:hypothetical protein
MKRPIVMPPEDQSHRKIPKRTTHFSIADPAMLAESETQFDGVIF